MLSAISHFSPSISHPYSAAVQEREKPAPETKLSPSETTNVKKENQTKNGSNQDLSTEELAQVQKLKQRDTEVKAHEQAHLSAAGGIATSGASFSYQRGPNGQRYAIGGEVQIDTSAVAGDPAATLRKADMIKRAALAPASPSSQDFKVASQAASMAAKAQADLLKMTQLNADPSNERQRRGSLFDQVS
ncbi:MAG: putative metalloprotease CJM1_0395 family protein [Methyloprofundus sp.]|nr:putative metalloprotease CJM1_0395 family protein [Methyloprofundus sp.]MDT8424655.1 putative metalloprotease CJM1_0395 family protein [Methyloprofundus sp.]